jgi:hypothetical protein
MSPLDHAATAQVRWRRCVVRRQGACTLNLSALSKATGLNSETTDHSQWSRGPYVSGPQIQESIMDLLSLFQPAKGQQLHDRFWWLSVEPSTDSVAVAATLGAGSVAGVLHAVED